VSESSPGPANAQTVLADYGGVLAHFRDAPYGIPESRLPHPKPAIKRAIHGLLLELDGRNTELSRSLIEGYALLAQFIPDRDAETLHRGQRALRSGDPSHADWADAESSSRILTAIKLEMETLVHEIRLLAGLSRRPG